MVIKKTSKKISLRYGENPNQKADFIKNNNSKNLFNYQLSGKTISYNNILDINSGLDFLNEFDEPTAVVIKHNNACGIASSKKIEDALIKALESDNKSAFGGILLINRRFNINISKITFKIFFEAIVAPGFDLKTLKVYKEKKKVILIDSKKMIKSDRFSIKSVRGGFVRQKLITNKITKKNFKFASINKNITKKEFEDVLFAFKVVKHTKSNAIVLVKNKQTLGIGAGQMNRFDATRIAIMKYKDNFKLKNIICASDAFFPFIDSLKILLKNNCNCIIEPSGSINDKKVIEFANQNNLRLLFSKIRVFKH